jgi:hypothetical protein
MMGTLWGSFRDIDSNSTCHEQALGHAADTVLKTANEGQVHSKFDMETVWASYQGHLEGKTADKPGTNEQEAIMRQAEHILKEADKVAQEKWKRQFTEHALGVKTHRDVLFHIEQIYASLEASQAEMLKASQEVFLTYSDANALEALITAANNISSEQDSLRHKQALHSLMDTVLNNRPGSHKPDVDEPTHQTLTPVAQTGHTIGY